MKYLKFLLCVFVTLFCALPIFSQIPSYIPTNGLVGWWPFNGNANDESGNGNNGTVFGPTMSSDRFNQINSSYYFDGNNDYISTSTSGILGTQNRTISFWLNTNSSVGQQVIGYGLQPPSGGEFNILLNQICQGVSIDVHNNYITYTYPAQYIFGSWNHIVATYENSVSDKIDGVKFFVNGALLTTAIACSNPINETIITLNSPIYFGKYQSGNFGYYSGKLDDIAIWNRALTSQEISTLYNQSCNWNITPLITGSSFAYADSVYTYSVQQQNGRTYQWSTKNGGSIVGSSTNSIVQVEWDTVARDTLLVRETDTQSGCYKDTMLIVSSKFPVYYKATWVNTAPRILPNPTNGMSCYPGTPNCVGGMIDSTTNPGSRSVTFGTFNARPDTIIGINPILPTIRFQIVYRDNGSVIHDTGPLGSDRLTYDSRIGLVTCKLGPFTYDYGRELAMKVISPSGTQTTDIVSLVKANGELYIIPE